MFQAPNFPPKIARQAKPPRVETHPAATPRLTAAMSCDTAFRIIGRRHLASLGACQEATCGGDANALHEMRVALTHLRAAIKLFSPMVDDAVKQRVWSELKWLNGELGAVRDLDVAVGRISAVSPRRPEAIPHFESWREKRNQGYRELARSLQSARFRRLIAQTAAWITSGPWCTTAGKQAAKRRASPVAIYGARRLVEWEKVLLRKCRKLRGMDARKRHRLRILNKGLTCSIESFGDLLKDKELSKQKKALKPLRKAQRSLGRLNDDVSVRALALSFHKAGIPVPLPLLRPKREKRLLRATQKAYDKLAALRLDRKE